MSEFAVTIAPSQIDTFFTKLAETGNASAAALHSNISRAYVYKLRKTDADFAARWADAIGDRSERVLEALHDEGVAGTPVLDESGRVVGFRRNTTVLLRLGEKYGHIDPAKPSVAIQNNVNAPAAAPAATVADEEKRLHEIAMRELRTITVEATPVDPDEDIL
jgi:hypothetical protein